MIQVTVFYPYQPGKSFDMEYYVNRHIPMVKEKLGEACKSASVLKGVACIPPGTPPVYTAMTLFTFESIDTFRQAFNPHAETIMADRTNYTTIQPIIQIDEIKL